MWLLRAYGPALAWAALVLFLGGQRNLQGPEVDLPIDKLAHFFLYSVLGALAGWGWQRAGRRLARVWPLLAMLLLGAGDELHQRRVPGRSAEAADWIADAAGCLIGFVFVSRWVVRTRERGGHES